ncbi:peptide-methionine (R)-S-oxide reductase MsrB [Streptomyces sp. ACA25]|uniref:peptide-methionine (R)-S-oxide reductase MsrB n=1 Tax=Streptomyces sp. ACA25 TaxID=3022596 RepID=UPI002306E0CE|nr:peptide-methionine (R)-S-oxide reductase MsrB [Streptomyces sp. ACA25]MDB1089168.1 peptide-methionine (R)-S-oxide reductase MsrB [Streptomyces sp. ACA25]
MGYEVEKSDAQWREELTDEEYRVLRQAGTEQAFTGEYTDTRTVGVYTCRGCGTELFRSGTKFDSHCGWPSFYDPADSEAVELLPDHSIPGRPRTEVRCSSCGSHLGHVFSGEGYGTPTDQRYCINSIAVRLEPEKG